MRERTRGEKRQSRKTAKAVNKARQTGDVKETVNACLEAIKMAMGTDLGQCCSEVSVEMGGIKITASRHHDAPKTPKKEEEHGLRNAEELAGGEDRPDMLPPG